MRRRKIVPTPIKMSCAKRGILRRLLGCLEDPKHPSLGPHLHLLGFFGLWQPSNTNTPFTRFKQFLFYLTIAFFFNQYIKVAVNRDVDDLKLLLQYASFHVGVVKSCFFQKQHRLWEDLITYISSLEHNQSINKKEIGQTIDDYISRNRRVTYFFWVLAILCNIAIFTEPYQKNGVFENGTSIYLNVFDAYNPFDREPPGYYASMALQTILGHIISGYVIGWDTLIVSIMIFFAGQLKIARYYCVHIIEKNVIKTHQNIANFLQHYSTLIMYHKIFNSLISPVMFVYLIVISLNLGVCIIQIVELKDNFTAILSACVYIAGCLVQLIIFYWYGNEVIIESSLVSYGTFESDWVNTDKHMLKQIALLGLTSRKRLVFRAGLFHEISIATFIAILRTSYSFYTLLNGTH